MTKKKKEKKVMTNKNILNGEINFQTAEHKDKLKKI